MPKVTFMPQNLTREAPVGKSIMELADEAGADISFSCRVGVCNTCIVRIVSGMENLEPPLEQEKLTLEAFGAAPNERLACMCKIKGDVVVETKR